MEEIKENDAQKEPLSAFNKAEAILKRIEEANAKAEENIKRQDELMAAAVLSGKSFAGQAPVKIEESPAEYKKRIMSGRL